MSQTTNNNRLDFRGNRAYIIGTTHRADIVARMYTDYGVPVAEVAEYYDIEQADVYAALNYVRENPTALTSEAAASAISHREETDERRARFEARFRKMREGVIS